MSANQMAWMGAWISTLLTFAYGVYLMRYWNRRCREVDALLAATDASLRAAWRVVPESEREPLRRRNPAIVAFLEQQVH